MKYYSKISFKRRKFALDRIAQKVILFYFIFFVPTMSFKLTSILETHSHMLIMHVMDALSVVLSWLLAGFFSISFCLQWRLSSEYHKNRKKKKVMKRAK